MNANNVLSSILSILSAAPALVADGEELVAKGTDILTNTAEGRALENIFSSLIHHTPASSGAPAVLLTPKTAPAVSASK